MTEKIPVPLWAPIETLNLETRTQNTLKRSGITTVAAVLALTGRLVASDMHNFGEMGLKEVEKAISGLEIANLPIKAIIRAKNKRAPQAKRFVLPAEQEVDEEELPLEEQADLVRSQLYEGVLHRHVEMGGQTVLEWLQQPSQNKQLLNILNGPLTICEELERILNLQYFDSRYIDVFRLRFGRVGCTIEEIGDMLSLSLHKVRHITFKLEYYVNSNLSYASTARIQTALLIARHMGDTITYQTWLRTIKSSGLLGACGQVGDMDTADFLLAICDIADKSKFPQLTVPDNLAIVAENPNTSARTVRLVADLPRETRKLIRRHSALSGAVYSCWLSENLQLDVRAVEELLSALDFEAMGNNWFIPKKVKEEVAELESRHPFHHNIRKMLQYCGSLSVDNICSGLQNTMCRTDFPVPSPAIMEQLLPLYGFKRQGNKFFWEGQLDTTLSASEKIVWDCIIEMGPVVQHRQVVRSFSDKGFSVSYMRQGLNYSPLFCRIGQGLYKIRGHAVKDDDIQRARDYGARIPSEIEVQYREQGLVVLSVSLESIAVATGTICCEHPPKLWGEWQLLNGVDGERLVVKNSEIRHLRKVFETLGCGVGDRVELSFHTWDRTVDIKKCDAGLL